MPHFPPESPEPIVVAEIVESNFGHSQFVPAEPSRSCFVPALIILGVFSLLMLAAGVGLWQFLAPAVVKQNAAERSAANDTQYVKAHQAFSNDWQADDGRELAAIERLARRVSQIATFEVKPQLSTVIDYSRFAQQMRRYPELGSQAYLGNKLLGATVQFQLLGPIPFSDFKIFKVETLSANERLVYLQTSGEYGDATPYLWWIVYRDQKWKLFDWHALEYSVSEAHEMAGLRGESDLQKNNGYDRYCNLCQLLDTEIDNFYEPSTRANIISLSREIERLKLPDTVVSTIQFDTVSRLYYSDNLSEAIRVANLIAEPARAPGVYRLLGKIHAQRNEYELAIEQLNLYLNRLGPDIETLSTLADCYRDLDQPAKEREYRLQALRFSSTVDQQVDNYYRLIFLSLDSQLEALFKSIDETKDSDVIYTTLLERVPVRPCFQLEIERLANHIAAKADTEAAIEPAGAMKSMLTLAQANLQLAKRDFRSGFELRHQFLAAQDAPVWHSFWHDAMELGVVEVAYQVFENKLDAFAAIVELYESHDYDFSVDDLNEIVELHGTQFPDDQLVTFYRGKIAFSKRDYQRVVELFSGLQLPQSDADEADYQTSSDSDYVGLEAGRLLAMAYLYAGDTIRAIESANSSAALDSLFDIARGRHDLKLMEQLLANDGWDEGSQKRAQAIQLAERGEKKSAMELLASMINAAAGDAERNSFNYDNYLNASALIELCSDSNDVLQAYEMAPVESVFAKCSSELTGNSDWQAAQILNQRLREQLDSDPENIELAMRVHSAEIQGSWKQQEYQDLVNRFADSQFDFNSDAHAISESDLECIARAAIRAGNLPAARQAATLLAERHDNVQILVLVALHEKKFVESSVLIQRLYYSPDFFHYDLDTPELSKTELATMQSDRPRSLINYEMDYGTTIEMLFAGIESVTSQMIEEVGTSMDIKDYSTTPIRDAQLNSQAWLLRGKDFDITISRSRLPRYDGDESAGEWMQDLLSQQKSAVSVFVRAVRPVTEGQELAAGLKIANQLVKKLQTPKDCLLIGFDDYWLDWSTAQPRVEKFVNRELDIRQLRRAAKHVGLYADADLDSISAEHRNAFEQSFVNANSGILSIDDEAIPDAHSDAHSDGPLVVFSKLTVGEANETVSIQVQQVIKDDYEGLRIIGTLQENSHLDRSLQAGDSVELSFFAIWKWECGTESGTLAESGTLVNARPR